MSVVYNFLFILLCLFWYFKIKLIWLKMVFINNLYHSQIEEAQWEKNTCIWERKAKDILNTHCHSKIGILKSLALQVFLIMDLPRDTLI